MIIKAITLGNFKGIKDPVTIELKPITLLFGPNSAGKSTILQALVYAREILERHNLDPDRTLLGGEWMDLGGFKSLIHDHDLDEAITIGFELDLTEQGVPDYLTESEAYVLESWEYQTFPDIWLSNIQQAAFSLTIRWSERLNKPIVQKVNIEINYQAFAEIECTLDARDVSFKLVTLAHDIFTPYTADEDESQHLSSWLTEEIFGGALKAEQMSNEDPDKYSDAISTVLSIPLDGEKLPDVALNNLDEALEEISYYEESLKASNYGSIGLVEQKDALPVRDRKLQIDSNAWRSGEDKFGPVADHPLATELFITSIFSALIVGPLDHACSELDRLLYVGPFREIPQRNHTPMRSPDMSRWARGLAAWDLLMTEDKSLIEKTNDWLGSEDKINSNYNIEAHSYKLLDMDGPLYRALNESTYMSDDFVGYDLISTYLSEAPERKELKIIYTETGTRLDPADLGVGVSQIIPIIVSALYSKSGIVSMEQPELHIHPAWQVILGDLFLSQIKDKDSMFLIETHSEHLVLRIMRRIRETYTNSLPPGAPEAKPDDIAILYVESDNGKTIVRDMPLNKTGEFVKAWPGGFFEERFPEMF